MRVLVTGGAGFIGSHVADGLLAAGHDVTILDDLSSGRRQNVPGAARLTVGDIRDARLVQSIFDELRPEVVCHQAAQTSVVVSTREPVRDAEVNVLGTLELLRAAAASGVRSFVVASTGGAIYGEVEEGASATTAWQPAPRSPYACSKLACEVYTRAYGAVHGFRTTVLRYANVFGPRQDPHGEAGVVAIFCERLLRNRPLRINARCTAGDDGCVRDYVYVSDVVDANLAAVRGDLADRTVNVATGTGTGTRELAVLLAAAAGVELRSEPGPPRDGDLGRSVLEPDLPPRVTLREGIERTVDWFRAADGSQQRDDP